MKQPENLVFPLFAWDMDQKSLMPNFIFDKENYVFAIVFQLQLTPLL